VASHPREPWPRAAGAGMASQFASATNPGEDDRNVKKTTRRTARPPPAARSIAAVPAIVSQFLVAESSNVDGNHKGSKRRKQIPPPGDGSSTAEERAFATGPDKSLPPSTKENGAVPVYSLDCSDSSSSEEIPRAFHKRKRPATTASEADRNPVPCGGNGNGVNSVDGETLPFFGFGSPVRRKQQQQQETVVDLLTPEPSPKPEIPRTKVIRIAELSCWSSSSSDSSCDLPVASNPSDTAKRNALAESQTDHSLLFSSPEIENSPLPPRFSQKKSPPTTATTEGTPSLSRNVGSAEAACAPAKNNEKPEHGDDDSDDDSDDNIFGDSDSFPAGLGATRKAWGTQPASAPSVSSLPDKKVDPEPGRDGLGGIVDLLDDDSDEDGIADSGRGGELTKGLAPVPTRSARETETKPREVCNEPLLSSPQAGATIAGRIPPGVTTTRGSGALSLSPWGCGSDSNDGSNSSPEFGRSLRERLDKVRGKNPQEVIELDDDSSSSDSD